MGGGCGLLGVRGDKIPPPVGEVYKDLAGEGTEVSVTPPLRRARHVAGIACLRVATKREPYGAVGDRYRISLRDARFAARAVERDGEVLIRAEGVWAERECFELEGRAVGTCGDGGAWKHAQKVPRRRHQRVALAHEVRGVVVLCEAGGACGARAEVRSYAGGGEVAGVGLLQAKGPGVSLGIPVARRIFMLPPA